jgi:hypothetical protein
MHALLFAEKPPECAIFLKFLEFNPCPGISRKVRGILVCASISSFLGRKVMPLFARYLAGTTADTLANINEYRFRHCFSPYLALMSHKNALNSGMPVLASAMQDVRRLPLSPLDNPI